MDRSIRAGRATVDGASSDRDHHTAVGKQSLIQSPAPEQARDHGVVRADAAQGVKTLAAKGVASASERLPHLTRIQALFGRHDVSAVRVQVGGAADEACSAIGASAYASGDRIAFASPPDLHTAAHEAAHVVQQRAGVQVRNGVGQPGDPHEQHADAVADEVVRGRSAEPLLDRYAAGPGTTSTAAPIQMIAIKIHKEDLNSDEDLSTDTDVLTEGQARAVLTNRQNYSAAQVMAAQARLETVAGMQQKVTSRPTVRRQTRVPLSKRASTKAKQISDAENNNNAPPNKQSAPVSLPPMRRDREMLGRIKQTVSTPPQQIAVPLTPFVLPCGTLTIKMTQQQPQEANEAPVMHTDFAFVPGPSVAHPDALRTNVMFRLVEDGSPYHYDDDSQNAPLNEMMTAADPATGVEEGWVMDIDPGVYMPVDGVSRHDYRRTESRDPRITPFYGDSGTATEYRHQTDGKVGYVDTPSPVPKIGKTTTYHYLVVITDTTGTATTVGDPVLTASWSFDFTTDRNGLSSIQNLVAPQATQGAGSAPDAARFGASLEQFDSYYRNPEGHTPPLSIDANHFLYMLGSVPLDDRDRELAALIAGVGRPPTAQQMMNIKDKCDAYLKALDLQIANAGSEGPNSARDVALVKRQAVQELSTAARAPDTLTSYFRSSERRVASVAFDANHWLYELGSVPLNEHDRELADLLANLPDRPTGSQVMSIRDACSTYLPKLDHQLEAAPGSAPNSARDVATTKRRVVVQLKEACEKSLAIL